MRLVPAFRIGEGEQDVPFFARPPAGEVTVDGGFGPFVGEVSAPALDVGGARLARGSG